jgi:hypothetical protein
MMTDEERRAELEELNRKDARRRKRSLARARKELAAAWSNEKGFARLRAISDEEWAAAEAADRRKMEVGMENELAMIAESLRRIQEEGGEGNFAIFTVGAQKNYYVQFQAGRGQMSLYAEAVSNEWLEPEFALSSEQIMHLQSMGWNAPDVSSPNFYRDWEAVTDEDRLQIARGVMRTFAEVYGWMPGQPIDVELMLE